MNLSELFIRRAITTSLLMFGILLFGVMGYRLLPVSDLPNVDFPTITVSASIPGAAPETMAASVATPLERQFSTIAGLDNMSSSSSQGRTQITLQFSLSRDIDSAAQDVQAAIGAISRDLPPEMPAPPSYQKVNPAASPIFFIALTSKLMPLSQLDEYAETVLAQRISTISGVAQVDVMGAQKYAVRVQLDPQALAARGIGLDTVSTAIQNHNVDLPSGTLQGTNQSFNLQAEGQLMNAAAYRPIIVAYRNGSPIRLQELGTVTDSVENTRTAGWFYDRKAQTMDRGMVLAISRQPGSNTVEIATAIRQLMPKLQVQMPAAITMNVLFDRSEGIQRSMQDVKFTMLLTIALVVLTIFVFLRNVSATIIPSLALPFSLIGTFAAMYLLGFSMDNLSMMALTLSVGFVVDDAIVMLENIVRHMEMGEKPMEAALNGSREISFTILSMTISLAAVFIPLLFMGGILGRLFREFAVTIGVAILFSGFISLTLTPMLCSRFLKPESEQRHGRFFKWSEHGFDAMRDFYGWTLRFSLHHRPVMMALSVALLVGSGFLFMISPKGFIPSEDTGQLSGSTEAIQGIGYDAMVKHQQAAAAIVAKDPNVDAFMSRVGGPATNSGFFFIRLKPRNERKLSVDQIIQELRPKLARLTGVNVFLQNPPTIRLGGRSAKSLYQYTLQGTDTDELYQYAAVMQDKMSQLPILQDVTSDLQLTNPQLNIAVDRDRAMALGVTTRQVEQAIYDAFGQHQVSTINAATNAYRVIMELQPQYQMDPAVLSLLYIHPSGTQSSGADSASGNSAAPGSAPTNPTIVPLSAVTTLKRTAGPLSVTHAGQLPAVTLAFNLQPGHSLSEAVAQVDALAHQTLPATITTNFQGTAQAFQSSLQGLGWLLLLAILVIYIVLGILYESLIHPITILSGLPSAGVGALLTLLLFRTELSIYAFVGIIMLVGLVKKNGIMMVDFAIESQRNEQKSPEEAIYDACLVRFRPIMMTTMAALLGTLPIAIGFGTGSEARRPLGLAVVGGLLFSQFLTLYITPVFYVYMEQMKAWLSRVRGRQPEPRRDRPIKQAPVPEGALAEPSPAGGGGGQ